MTKSHNSGLFITLEGGDGTGKSTQAIALEKVLLARGHEVVRTREPGGTPVGHAIRKVLLDNENPPTPMCELLLFLASRAQHIEQRIRPALARGATVICDRYATTTLVYQGLARGLGEAAVMSLACMVEDGVRPDLALVLDLDPEVALARVDARGGANRIDNETMSFHRTVRSGFCHYAQRFADNHRLIDADTDTQTLTQRLLDVIDDYQSAHAPIQAGVA